jgi:NDP-sugar pyrophosphorylase family protein
MIPVAGEPFIAHQLRLLRNAGFCEIALLSGFMGEQIQEYVGDGAQFGLNVRYAFDGPVLLGTGGAIRAALPLLGEEFIVVYGDSYCPTDYRRIFNAFRSARQPALMTVFHNRHRWDKSNVEFRDGRIVRYDKTSHDQTMLFIDYGVNVFSSSVFRDINTQSGFDLANVHRQLVAAGQLAGLEIYERFYEVGSPAGLRETEALLAVPASNIDYSQESESTDLE